MSREIFNRSIHDDLEYLEGANCSAVYSSARGMLDVYKNSTTDFIVSFAKSKESTLITKDIFLKIFSIFDSIGEYNNRDDRVIQIEDVIVSDEAINFLCDKKVHPVLKIDFIAITSNRARDPQLISNSNYLKKTVETVIKILEVQNKYCVIEDVDLFYSSQQLGKAIEADYISSIKYGQLSRRSNVLTLLQDIDDYILELRFISFCYSSHTGTFGNYLESLKEIFEPVTENLNSDYRQLGSIAKSMCTIIKSKPELRDIIYSLTREEIVNNVSTLRIYTGEVLEAVKANSRLNDTKKSLKCSILLNSKSESHRFLNNYITEDLIDEAAAILKRNIDDDIEYFDSSISYILVMFTNVFMKTDSKTAEAFLKIALKEPLTNLDWLYKELSENDDYSKRRKLFDEARKIENLYKMIAEDKIDLETPLEWFYAMLD